MRVLHLGKYYPPARGGIESHVRTLARGQADAGAQVTVVCVNHLDAAGDDVTWRTVGRTPTTDTHDGAVRVLRVGRIGNVGRLDVCPSLVPRLAREVASADVVHLHVPNPTMMLALAALPFGRLVITHHSDIVRQRRARLLLRPTQHLLYRRAARILATSPRYIDRSALLTRYRERVEVVPLGIDRTPFLGPDSERPDGAAPVWLFVGRLVYYKGLEIGIRALVDVPGELRVIGEGPLFTSLKALAERLGVGERVRWLGEVSAEVLRDSYRRATALWLPSCERSEAFGLVQVEAMASGCPVVNTAIPGSGVPWVCPHEVAGLTAPANEPAAFAAAARRLLDEPGLRDRLSAGARARAEAEFDWRTMAARTLEHYGAR